MTPEGAAEGKTSPLENALFRGDKPRRGSKKAAVIAIMAAILGTGGATNLVQLWTRARLAPAETALKEAQVRYKDREQKLKEDAMVMETRRKEQE